MPNERFMKKAENLYKTGRPDLRILKFTISFIIGN